MRGGWEPGQPGQPGQGVTPQGAYALGQSSKLKLMSVNVSHTLAVKLPFFNFNAVTDKSKV